MKVTKTNQGIFGNVDVVTGEKKDAEGISESFGSRLKKAASDNYENKIMLIISQIENQAEILSKKVDIRELKTYKRLVSEFLDAAVSNSHKFFKENKLDRRGRHRIYAIIKQINQDVEDLTQEILKEEKDNLLILQKLDDIRGLILDIST